MAFFEAATEDLVAIFDEDDYFTPDYIMRAVHALLDQRKDLVWNFQNRIVTRQKIMRGRYRSAFGTIVARREIMFAVAKSLWYKIYGKEWYPGARPPQGFVYGNRGCQDANYHVMLVQRLERRDVAVNDGFEQGEHIGLHAGERWYVEHLNSNTCNGRMDENCIDYWMPELWYRGTRFEKARNSI
jgi:hypothetical protein